jgi:hypothetical protein
MICVSGPAQVDMPWLASVRTGRRWQRCARQQHHKLTQPHIRTIFGQRTTATQENRERFAITPLLTSSGRLGSG